MGQTNNLKLNKHDNPSTNENSFDIENYLNANWDKIDVKAGELDASVQESEGNISTLQERVSTNEDNIETLQSKVTTAESDIETLQTEVTELQEDVQNLRNASYKVSGSGTNFSLNNTTKNKFIEFLPGGNTEQTQLSGKNLLDTYGYFKNTPTITSNGITLTLNNDGSLLLNGTATALTTFSAFGSFSSTDIVINLDANKTYNLAMNSNQIISENFIVYVRSMENGNLVSKVARTSSNTNTFTSSTGITNYSIQIPNGTTLNNVLIKPQLEEGTTATDYEPYCGGITSPNFKYQQPIYNVTGNVKNKIENKNLFDVGSQKTDYSKEDVINGFDSSEVKINVLASGSTYSYRLQNFIGNKTYTFTAKPSAGYSRVYVRLRNLDDTGWLSSSDVTINGMDYVAGYQGWYSTFTGTDIQKTINIPECKYCQFGIGYSSQTSIVGTVQTISNIQLEYGSTATSYEEHQEQNYPFTFAEGQRGMKGTQLLDNGIHQKRKQKIFDGTENWHAFTLQGKTAYYINLPDGTGQEVKCSHFISQISGGFPGENKVIYNGTTNKNIVFYIGDTENKLTEWKASLAEQYANGTPVIVEYILEEEEIIPYNETQQAQYDAIEKTMSYNDQTNISSESDEVGMIIDATAVGDINKAISNIDSRVSLLE